MINKKWLPLISAVFLLAVILCWEKFQPKITDNQTSGAESLAPAISEDSKSDDFSDKEIKLTLLGDIMCHPAQFQAARLANEYDFSPSFEEIRPDTGQADITLANLETTLAGSDKTYSGYPSFNTPEQIAPALKDTLGIDVLSTANNHCLDRNFSGLCRTIDFLDQYGLEHTGTYKTKKDSEHILIKETDGIKIAFLSYTYGTNGITLPVGQSYAVNYMDKQKIRQDALKAHTLGANLIILSLHWGQEYASQPSDSQRSLALWLLENTEVDIISGNHAHTVQPIEFVKVTPPGSNQSKNGLVIYAQGNFISDQKTKSANRSIIVNIYLTTAPINGQSLIKRVTYVPCWVDKTPNAGLRTFRVLNVPEALKDYAAGSDPLLSAEDFSDMASFSQSVHKLIPDTAMISSAGR